MNIDFAQMVLPEDRSAADLAKRRAGMVCSRLQGRLIAGPEICAQLDATAADPATPWAMREPILNANEWRRTSQTIDERAWDLGFSAEQIDALFEAGMACTVCSNPPPRTMLPRAGRSGAGR